MLERWGFLYLSLRWAFSFYTPVEFTLGVFFMTKESNLTQEQINNQKRKYADMFLSARSLAEDLGYSGPLFYNTAKKTEQNKKENSAKEK